MVNSQVLELGPCWRPVQGRLAGIEHADFGRRLWQRDPRLWSTKPAVQENIANSLGWLDVVDRVEKRLGEIDTFIRGVKGAGFKHAVHMGMGGSSLAPLVFQKMFAGSPGGVPVEILDSTDPHTILDLERRLPPAQTLFIVASKSGTTSEPNAFMEYFFQKVKAVKGARAGENFVAVTDPGTSLVKTAEDRRFRHTFLNYADIGGRYSALSLFGLVPAALMGVDITAVLHRARTMLQASSADIPARDNPGLILGAVLGELARVGRDKITFLTQGSMTALAMWIEQLLAESTGKEGRGLVPVVGEPAGGPHVYGQDRLFVYIGMKASGANSLQRSAEVLQDAGHPVIRLEIEDRLDVGQEFLRWEIATAYAGAILGINPFDQPDVQESKEKTTALLEQLQATGSLPTGGPTLAKGPIEFYGDGNPESPEKLVWDLFSRTGPGDYFCIQGFLPELAEVDEALEHIRVRVRDRLQIATTNGYGPRFLHSTGQLHKGGPNTGVFLQITSDDEEDADVPGTGYSFGALEKAQALGDLETLKGRGRRIVRAHLRGRPLESLRALQEVLAGSLVAAPAYPGAEPEQGQVCQ